MAMSSIAFVLASLFVLGLVKGSAVCTTVCGPGLVPYIVIKRKTPLEALKLSSLFCLPRLVLFSFLGGVVGYLVYELASIDGIVGISGTLHTYIYLIFGAILVIMGFYLLAKSIDEGADFREGNLSPGTKLAEHCKAEKKIERGSGIFSRLLDPGKAPTKWKENGAMLILGWGMGLGCLAELTLVEGTLFSGYTAVMGSSALSSILLGFSGMFIFSIGLSFPLVALAAASAYFSGRIDTLKGLNVFKRIASVVMMGLGTLMIVLNAGRI